MTRALVTPAPRARHAGTVPMHAEARQWLGRLVVALAAAGLPDPLVYPYSGDGVSLEWVAAADDIALVWDRVCGVLRLEVCDPFGLDVGVETQFALTAVEPVVSVLAEFFPCC